MKRLNRKGQGATEYIVILAIIVGIILAVFYGPLKTALSAAVGSIASSITNP